MEFSTIAEAADYLVWALENDGVFVTPADMLPLVPQLLTLPGDGSAIITGDFSAIPQRARKLLSIPERADCPHEWCTGDRAAHASFNPDEWEHTAPFDSLAPADMLIGTLTKVGDAAPFYTLSGESYEEALCTVSAMLARADEFERHAVTLRERAAQLEALGGIQ